MKEYRKPESEIILPNECDILTSSTTGTDTPYVEEEEQSDILG